FSIHASAQNPHFPKVKISVPCANEFIKNYKGKWLIHEPVSVTDYHDEVMRRLNAINDLIRQIYPQPTGGDAGWSGEFAKTSFADEVKYVPVEDRDPEETKTKINPVYRYKYSCILFPWICTGNQNEIMNMYPEGSSGSIVIRANDLEILNENYVDANEWTIEGRPIKRKMFAAGKWNGYDMMSSVGGIYANAASEHFVLISRDGILPYIPITRKQYLDRAIQYITRYYDELTKKLLQANEALPAQFRSPQTEIDDQKDRNTKAKNDALKKLHDALEKTTKDGLLDAPAVVRIDPLLMNEGPVFQSEAEGGCMLVTENPNYFRKELPKYVPQFFVIELMPGDPQHSNMNFKNIIDENFPIEKLKAMIDK
ncbi:MAG TPA: hypothetical protein VKB95_09265, partial [Chitinophagaceae bacterium]|nr:hypothetical protein [Chitinophagaceae bacterium]